MQKFTKKQILRLPEEISQVLKHRQKTSQHLILYKTSGETPVSRLGLAIPKKNAKRAVDRNRIKRIIRETFRQSSYKNPKDIVVKLSTPIGKKTRRRLREAERLQIRQQVKVLIQDE